MEHRDGNWDANSIDVDWPFWYSLILCQEQRGLLQVGWSITS